LLTAIFSGLVAPPMPVGAVIVSVGTASEPAALLEMLLAVSASVA
jgi:hypothetical protein